MTAKNIQNYCSFFIHFLTAIDTRVDEDKKFQIDEKTAPVVQKIFEMYASGSTIFQIINHLNERNIKTSRGVEFNKNSLRLMLSNKRYIGIYTYKDKEIKDGIARIISDELFYKVQEILQKNKKAPARAKAKDEYLLTTKLFCGHCKAMMTGMSGTARTGAIHNYYACNNRLMIVFNAGNRPVTVDTELIDELEHESGLYLNDSALPKQKPSIDKRDFVGGWFLFCPKVRRFITI